MNQKVDIPDRDENISFLSIFTIFNKKNILKTAIITLLFLVLGLVYLYFSTPRYISYTSLEVDAKADKLNKANADDLINTLYLPNISDIETEMDVLQSDLLISKVLGKISDGIKYYDFSTLKKHEYYSHSPIALDEIKVLSKEIFNKYFMVTIIDEQHFKLERKSSFLHHIMNALFSFDKTDTISGKIYRFGQRVKGENFSFLIKNVNVVKGKKYAFKIMYQPTAIKDTKKYLNIKPASARSSVIRISYEDNNPYRVKDFLELLSYEYIKQNIDNKSKIASSTLSFLKKQLKTVKKQLKISSDKLKEYKERNNFIDINTRSREIVDKLVEYDKQYAQEKLEYQAFSILRAELERGNFSAMSGFSKDYPILDNLVSDLQKGRSQREALLTTLTKRHPDVVAVTKQINESKKNIKNISLGVEKGLKSKLYALKKMVQKENKLMEKLPQKEQNLATLERLFGVNEKLFSYLLQRQSELSLLQASKVSDIRILDKAAVALKPSKPNKNIVMMSSLFLGLIFSFFISLFSFNKRIKTPEDVAQYTDIPLFGIIPYVENQQSYNSAYVLEDTTSTASEAFRAVRSNLDYIDTAKGSKVVLVTSNIPNEGKTVVAVNLASTIGMSEKKVIILSLDLRRPEMHHKFGLSNKIGMSDILAQKVSLKDAIWEHELYPNLNIITSGRIPPNPAELLASKKMKKVIKKLKKEYDYIILDTPPINYVSDAVALFKYADINLFVVKSDFTEQKYLHELDHLVDKLSLEKSGIILNSVKKKYNTKEQFDYKYLYYEPL